MKTESRCEYGKFRSEFKGMTATLPNPYILISALSLQVAQDSSEFENIFTTQDELYPADIYEARAKNQAAKSEDNESPEEPPKSSFKELRSQLVSELIDTLKTVDPTRFEQFVVDVLVAMGYDDGREGAARDVGKVVDGVIDEHRQGLDSIYVQARRSGSTIGRPIMQAVACPMQGYKANKGVINS